MKVLMVGLGSIGQRHLRNLRALLGDQLCATAYRARGLNQVVTEQLEIETGSSLEEKFNLRTYTQLDSALAQKPDAVFICNPTSLHLPMARQAALAGCHLFIEKPLAHDLGGVDELIALTEQRRLVAYVGCQMRFHPCLVRLRALLQQQAVGRVLAARVEVGEYLPGWHPYEDYRQSYAARRDLGGGVILTLIHELDYVYWLFGMPRKLFALGGQLSSLEIDVEDVASILMECVVDEKPVPVHVHLDFVQRPPSRTCTVLGDEGKILVDFSARTVVAFDGQGRAASTDTFADWERNQLFMDELAHFLACVRGEQKPLVSVREGAASLRLALAAKEAMASGRVVELSELPANREN